MPTTDPAMDPIHRKIMEALERMQGSKKAASDRFWDMAARFMVPVVMGLSAMLVSHEVRLAKIEANRFTASDAGMMEGRVHDWIGANLRTDLKAIEARLDDVLQRISGLEALAKGGGDGG